MRPSRSTPRTRRPFRRRSTWLPLLLTAAILGAASGARPVPRGAAAPLATQTHPGIAQPWGQVGGAMNAAVAHSGLIWLGLGPRVVVVDPSTPARPRVVGRSPMLPGVVTDLALATDPPRVWATAGDGLYAIDVAQPSRPAITASVAMPGDALRVTAHEAHVWAMDDAGTIFGVDAAARGTVAAAIRLDPAEPMVGADIAAGGGHLYRLGIASQPADAPALVDRWDLTRPRAPQPLSPLELEGNQSYLGGYEQLVWREDRLWALHGRGLSSFVEDEGDLEEASHDDFGWGGMPVAFVLRGDRAFVSFTSGWSDNFAVGIFDLTDPDDILPLTDAAFTTGRYPGVFTRAMTLVDDTLWVSSSGGFLTGLLIGPESFLRLAGRFSTVGEVAALRATGAGFFATANQSVQRLDLSAPFALEHDALVSAGYHYGDIAAAGDRVAIAVVGQSDMMNTALHLHRRDTPGAHAYERTAELGSPLPGASGSAVAVEGDTVVHGIHTLANGLLAIYDARDETSLPLATRHALSGRPTALSLVNDNLLTVVADDHALSLHRHRMADFALLDRAEQPLHGGLERWFRSSLVVEGDRAVVLATDRDPEAPVSELRYRQHLFVLDVAPDAPLALRASTTIGCAPTERAVDLALDGDHVFLACGDGRAADGDTKGIAVVDFTDLAAPRVARLLRTPFAPEAVAIVDEHLYVGTGPGGLLVYLEPTAGWNAEPEAPPTETPFPTLTPAPPTATGLTTVTPARTATPTPTATGPAATVWLPWGGR